MISNRIKDYLRAKNTRELPSSALAEQAAVVDYRESWREYQDADHRENRRSEVVQYIQELADYKLDLRQLAAATPKHRKARQRAFEAAQLLADLPDLKRHVRAKKELPLKEMEGKLKVSRKTLERQRKYIIALFIIITGDYSYLSDYLPGGEQVNRRALVLEMDSTHVTLLSDDGEFIRLPAGRLPQARYIGQSISMSQIKPKSKMGWMPLLAACIFIALVVIPMVSPPRLWPGSAWTTLPAWKCWWMANSTSGKSVL